MLPGLPVTLLVLSVVALLAPRPPAASALEVSPSASSISIAQQSCAGVAGPINYTGATLVGTTVVSTYVPTSTSCSVYPSEATQTTPPYQYSPSTAGQTCSGPGLGIAVGATLVGTTDVPTYVTNPIACYPGAASPSQIAGSGQYCAKGIEQIWIPSGAPTDGLTCPTPATGSIAAGASPTANASTTSSNPSPSTSPQPATTVAVMQNPTLGPILTDDHGMTLYSFAIDTPGVSNCDGDCASVWPPFSPPSGSLTAPSGVTGTLGVITRADGTQQVTYNGMPLYFYVTDKNPGDTKGQGIQPPAPTAYGGAWNVVAP